MSFQSLRFLAFFSVTLAACLTAGRRNRRTGKVLLGAACMVFYLWEFSTQSSAGFLTLGVGVAVSAAAARYLLSGKPEQGRRRVFTAAVAWHVLVLLVFKYTGFLTGGAVRIGWVPLGLSFFTFQQVWYLKELYTRQYRPDTVGDLALFSFFFPTVSSGPILRPQDFFPQLAGKKFLHPDWDDAAAGLYAIACGCIKKVLLADPLGVIVGNGWAHPESLTAPDAWMVILGYTLQLYLDFSGYCDMAAGMARLLGIRLPANFDSPYRSLSVGEFWKRWHITLTSFLRECIYFPLGGSRRGVWRTYRNILLVFVISGFWHGAGWTFLLWGTLHGLAQVTERLWGAGRNRLPKWLRWGMTFAFVNVAWVFFRAPDFASARAVLHAAVLGGLAWPEKWLLTGLLTSEVRAAETLVPALAGHAAPLLAAAVYLAGLTAALMRQNTIRRMDAFRPALPLALGTGLLFAWSVLSFTGITAFIYSNF